MKYLRALKLSDIIVILILSCGTSVCKNVYISTSFLGEGVVDTFLYALPIFVALLVLFLLLIHLGRYRNDKIDKLMPKWNRKSIIKTTCLLICMYVPTAVIFYPFRSGYDTINQLKDFYNGYATMPFNWMGGAVEIPFLLNDHHPITDTCIFAAFYRIGEWLGDPNIGMFIGVLMQLSITAFGFALMLAYLERMGVCTAYRLMGFLFFLIAPFIISYVSTFIKDTIYSCVFVFYFINYVQLCHEAGKADDNTTKRRMVLLIILSLLLALTKKTGIYFIVLANLPLICLFAIRKTRFKWYWATSIIVPIVMVFIIFARLLFPALDIYPGGKQEMIGTCMQHVARVKVDGFEATEEEKEIIREVMDYDNIEELYQYGTTDKIRNSYNYYCTDEERKEFLKLWVKWGVKHPMSYIKASISILYPLIGPGFGIEIYKMFPENGLGLEGADGMESARSFWENGYKELQEVPIVGMLLYKVIYLWWIPLAAIYIALRQRNNTNLLCLVPIIISTMVLLISPVAMARFGLSTIYTIPLIMGLISDSLKQNQ